MKMTTKGRYAIRALLDMAMHADEGPVLLRTIAGRQDISLQYLEHLVSPLIAAGIVRSIRGPKGGVMLARPAADIRMSEVMQVAEGPFVPAECLTNPDECDRIETCATRDFLEELKQAMDNVMEGTTLKDLMERQIQKEARKKSMYYI